MTSQYTWQKIHRKDWDNTRKHMCLRTEGILWNKRRETQVVIQDMMKEVVTYLFKNQPFGP